jgi:hypothetical protein
MPDKIIVIRDNNRDDVNWRDVSYCLGYFHKEVLPSSSPKYRELRKSGQPVAVIDYGSGWDFIISSDEGLLIEDQNAGEHTLYGAVKEVRTPPPKPDPTRMLWRLLGCFADREEQTFSPIWEKRWTEGK